MFRVRLKQFHDAKGHKTAYQVSKESGINQNTVRKYIESAVVEAGYIQPTLVELIQFYGLDWRDPRVIEYVPDEGESPKVKPPLAVAV